MSLAAAKALIEKMKSDKKFAEEVDVLKDMDKRMEFIRAAGYDCTFEEIKSLVEELTDEQLDKIAGGDDDPEMRECQKCNLYYIWCPPVAN